MTRAIDEVAVAGTPSNHLAQAQDGLCEAVMENAPASPVLRSLVRSIVEASNRMRDEMAVPDPFQGGLSPRQGDARFRNLIFGIGQEWINLQRVGEAARRHGNRFGQDQYERCRATQIFIDAMCGAPAQTTPPQRLRTLSRDFSLIRITNREYALSDCPSRVSRREMTEVECVNSLKRHRLLREEFETLQRNREPVPVLIEDASIIIPESSGRLGGHFMLMVGQQSVGGRCGYWFRNSYRCDFEPSNTISSCDPQRPEMVWVSLESLSGTGGISHSYHLAPSHP